VTFLLVCWLHARCSPRLSTATAPDGYDTPLKAIHSCMALLEVTVDRLLAEGKNTSVAMRKRGRLVYWAYRTLPAIAMRENLARPAL